MRKSILTISAFLIFANAEAQWLTDTIINDNNRRCRTGYNVARCLAAQGNDIYAVWTEEGYDVWLKAKHNGNWTNSERVSVGSPGGIYGLSTNPSLDISSGTINVVWEDYRTGDFEIFYRKFTSSGWGNPINLSGDGSNSRVPVITVTASGAIFLLWQDDRTGNYEIYCKLNTGGNWGNAEKISSTVYYAGFPTVAHFGDIVYAVWEQMENNGYELYYSVYTGVWSNPRRITTSEGMSQNPSVAVDASGTVHLVWTEDTGGNFLIYYSFYQNSNWSNPVSITSNPGEAITPQITSDPYGTVHLVWSDNRDGNYEILHKSLVSGIWSPAENISEKEGLSSSPHIVCTQDASIHTIWYDWAEDSIYSSPHILYRRYNPTLASLSNSISVRVNYSTVTISAARTKDKLTLFKTLAPYSVPVKLTATEFNRYIWSESLSSGKHSYILQNIKGTEVHYSQPIEVTIPNENLSLTLNVSPNPFTKKVEIRMQIPEITKMDNRNFPISQFPISLRIYDASGRLVKNLAISNFKFPVSKVTWDGRDSKDKLTPPGIYFLKLKYGQTWLSKKLVRIR